jgi:hypothetical protein
MSSSRPKVGPRGGDDHKHKLAKQAQSFNNDSLCFQMRLNDMQSDYFLKT